MRTASSRRSQCLGRRACARARACTCMRMHARALTCVCRQARALTRACMAPGGVHATPRCGAHCVRLHGRAVGAANRAARRLRRRARLRPRQHRRCGGCAVATGRHARADASQHGGRVAPPAEDKLVAASNAGHTRILAASPSTEFSIWFLSHYVCLSVVGKAVMWFTVYLITCVYNSSL